MELNGYILRTGFMLATMMLCIAAWSRIPGPLTKVYRFYGLVAILGLTVEITGMILLLSGRRALYIYNAYAAIELVCVMAMVAQVFTDLRLIAGISTAVGLFGLLVNAWLDGGLGPVLFEGVLLASVLQALLVLVVLWRMALSSERPVQHVPEFWLFMGLLLYFGGMAPFFALIRFVYANDPLVANTLWTLMPFLCMLRYAMGAWSCLLMRREALGPVHG